MDGEQTLVKIRKINPDVIVVIMIQSFVQDDVMFRLRLLSLKEKCAAGLIVKPVTIIGIEKKITELLY